MGVMRHYQCVLHITTYIGPIYFGASHIGKRQSIPRAWHLLGNYVRCCGRPSNITHPGLSWVLTPFLLPSEPIQACG